MENRYEVTGKEDRVSDLILEGIGKKQKPFKRDKSKNTSDFNRKVKIRRKKAKAAKVARKKNRK
jgi:hypothetical protein